MRKLATFLVLFFALAVPAAHAISDQSQFLSPPSPENPVSEGGKWTVPSQHGLSALWGDLRSVVNLIFGVSEPTQFGDPTGLMTGSWGPNQIVGAKVSIINSVIQTGGCCHEVELRLRNTMSASSLTGYEAYCSAMTSDQYCHIARWNGPNGSYCNIEPAAPNINVNDGDVMVATVAGTSGNVTVDLYVYTSTGTLKAHVTAVDNGAGCSTGGAAGPFYSGNPGLGFYDQGDGLWADFGFSSFGATDQVGQVYPIVTCNSSDLQVFLKGPIHTAIDKDVFNLASGSCAWPGGASIPASIGVTVSGTGTASGSASVIGSSSSCQSTSISFPLTSTANAFMFSFTPIASNSTTRLSCMKIATTGTGSTYPINVQGTCTSSGCPNVRLDNLTIPTGGLCSVSDASFVAITNMFGVADHNTVGDVAPTCNGPVLLNVSHGNWLGVGNWGDNSWAQPDTLGTSQQFFLENNNFVYGMGTDADVFGPSNGGGRFTCRFNTWVNSLTGGGACTNHGTDTIGRTRGGRQIEAYDNTINCSGGCGTLFGMRSGAEIAFGNAVSAGTSHNVAGVDTKRRWDADTPWVACDGSSPWDKNDGTIYYSGTIGSVGGSTGVGFYTVTDSGAPGWTPNQWQLYGSPYSFHDVTKGWGFEIASNNSNTLTTATNGGGSGNAAPSPGDSYQILRATACMDQPARGVGLLVRDTSGTNGIPVLNSTGSAGSVNEAIDPIYEFQDTGSVQEALTSDSQAVAYNRDLYFETANQNAQTSSTSPFTGIIATQSVSSWSCNFLSATNIPCTINVPSTAGLSVNQAIVVYGTNFGTPNTAYNADGSGIITSLTSTSVTFNNIYADTNTASAGGTLSSLGSGHGILARRPSSCTPGVGYFATDQGSWNSSGIGGQGQVFTCSAPNTWTLYYTPYTYPHPLIAGGSSGGTNQNGSCSESNTTTATATAQAQHRVGPTENNPTTDAINRPVLSGSVCIQRQ